MKKKLILPNVTILAATSSEVDEAQLSMRISMHNIKFGAAKLLCYSAPKKKYQDIEYFSISPLNSDNSYNQIIRIALIKTHFTRKNFKQIFCSQSKANS